MSTENKAWRELRARIRRSSELHVEPIGKRIAERVAADMGGQLISAQQQFEIRKYVRRLARRRAIADERRQRLGQAPAMTADELARKIRDINQVNRKYEKGMAAPFERRARKRPHLLWTETGFEQLRAEAMAVYEEQSAEAARKAKKPRPKKKPTYRSECISAMRLARKKGQSLNDFLGGAQNDAAFSIERTDNRNADEYTIDCFGVDNDKNRFKPSTLKEWWVAAGKKVRTD